MNYLNKAALLAAASLTALMSIATLPVAAQEEKTMAVVVKVAGDQRRQDGGSA